MILLSVLTGLTERLPYRVMVGGDIIPAHLLVMLFENCLLCVDNINKEDCNPYTRTPAGKEPQRDRIKKKVRKRVIRSGYTAIRMQTFVLWDCYSPLSARYSLVFNTV